LIFAFITLIGIIAFIYFFSIKEWFLVVISALFVIVAFDNILCGLK